MRIARHMRSGEPIRCADGATGLIVAHAVQPTDTLICRMDDGSRRDVLPERITWLPAERCWVEAR